MLDSDLAFLYEVEVKQLNQAVKRNIKRFPNDFMFRLTKNEFAEVVTNCDHLQNLKFRSTQPYVFTEQGVAMLAKDRLWQLKTGNNLHFFQFSAVFCAGFVVDNA